MNSKILTLMTSAIIVGNAPTAAVEAEWPTTSVGELSVFLASQMLRVQAEQCSSSIPYEDSKRRADLLANTLNNHLQNIAKDLLQSDDFRSMSALPVSTELLRTLKADLDKQTSLIQKNAASVCPNLIPKLSQMTADSDAGLKGWLKYVVTSVQKSIQAQTGPR